MSDELQLFQQFLFEADDIPPDEVQSDATGPPDVPEGEPDPTPPDVSDNPPDEGGDIGDDAPPDMGDGGFDDDGLDDFGDDGIGDDGNENMSLDGKISSILNVSLYQTFLTLLGNINEQINSMKHNTDILYSLAPDSLDELETLKKLDENIRLYLKNNFSNERYERNRLFFNKCINLFKLSGDSFSAHIKKGIKEYK